MSTYLDAAAAAYVKCALWASTIGEDGTPIDDEYGPDDLTPETLETMRAELADFVGLLERENVDYSTVDPEQFGHDFWLTRNGHGAGFWDRGLGELGDVLTKWAHSFGESHLYPGDDNRIYVA